MKYIIFFLLVVQSVFASSKQEAIAPIPQTVAEIDLFVEKALKDIEGKIKLFVSIPENERTFANTILAWDELGKSLFTQAATLRSLDTILVDKETIEKGKNGYLKISGAFSALLQDEKVLKPLLFYLEKVTSSSDLNQHELYYLNSFMPDKKLPSQMFTYKKGECDYKKGEKEFTLLNWNVCMLPGSLSLLFGGVLPWEKRIDKIAEQLKKIDADVICLQEVFDRNAASQLYTLLKDKYTDFYIHIAPRNFGFSLDSLGLGSGLFVASKFPTSSPHFEKFKEVLQPYIDRGLFSFEVACGDKKAQVVTTHLEATMEASETNSAPLNTRVSQLKQIFAYIEKTNCPHLSILCGDLNVYWGKNEPAEALLKGRFFDPYNEGRACCTLENCTYCDHTAYFWPQVKHDSSPQILDYMLVLKNQEKHTIQTKMIPFNNPENPIEALSDHNAEISTCSLTPTPT